MLRRTLVVAPHPDDEMIGAGGLLLRRKREGAAVGWVIVTSVPPDFGWNAEQIERRAAEIRQVAADVGFDDVFELALPAARLDQVPMARMVGAMADAFRKFQPDEVLLPHPGDAHTDHRAVYDAAAACTKWFRYPSVRRVLVYETLSETDFGLRPEQAFIPNVFVDISEHLDRKLEVLSRYVSEIGQHPFPRSPEAIRGLALVRGAAAGFGAAEAFQLLRERF